MKALLDTHAFLWWNSDDAQLHVYTLPGLHTDPFDRLLVAQSLLEGMPLISGDLEMTKYGVKVIW